MNRLKGSLIYLAGGIEYLPDLGIDWRQKAEFELRKLGIGILNPQDKATNFANEGYNEQANLQNLRKAAKLARKEGKIDLALEIRKEISRIMREIVRADLRMVDLASAILCRIDSTRHTAGTYAELTQAYLQRKPVILYCETGIEDIPLWWWGHGNRSMFFSSLDESIDYIRHIDQDEVIEHHKQWKFFNFDKVFGNEKS